MRHPASLLAFVLSLASLASADPRPGRAMPGFSVEDIAGTTHTQRDLVGHWTVLFVLTDKDTGPHVRPWFQALRAREPTVRLVTMAALDLFALVPTSTIVSQARSNTPRARWSEVWLSRDGSLARSLDLPESEVPWVIVVAPSGQVVEMVHSHFDDAALARVTRMLPGAPAAPSNTAAR